MARSLAAVLAALLLAAAASAPARAGGVVTDVRVGAFEGATRFVLTVDRDMPFKVFVLDKPYRAVIDLPEVGWRLPNAPLPAASGVFSRMRYGLFRPGLSRVVLDLTGPAAVQRAFNLPPQNGQRRRLVIDLRAAGEAVFKSRLGAPPITVGETAFAAAVTPAAKAPAPKPKAAPKAAPVKLAFGLPPPPKPARRGVITVVIDPGHGGVDPGAIGIGGTYEKHITLAMGRLLRDALNADGRYNAVMTRDRDVFIRLRNRITIAREKGADLFISLHADSIANPAISGPSVYTLSERASDKEAAQLAEKENKVDLLAGVDLGDTPPDVADILIDLTQRETMNQSAHFATGMIRQISTVTKPLRNTHRFAGFAVLKAHDVPSVLLEMGFLSSKVDEKRLKSKAYQRKFAAAMKKAVDGYFARVEEANRP
ncbi:MAG: N-acetylmuramoyl-L-alanine amidase [Rhodospirillales bacterium]